MFKSRSLQKLLFGLLYSFAFFLPFPYICTSFIIILLLFVWLIQARSETFVLLKTRKVIWLWVIFFLLHAISYFYSENKSESIYDLQSKLSFLILPIVIGTLAIDKKILERILLAFTTGITTIAIFCLCRAALIYYNTGTTEQFFYHPLVTNLDANAVYEALYTIISLATLLSFSWKTIFAQYPILKWLSFIIQFVFFLLLSSRTLIIIFFLFVIPVYLVKLILNRELPKFQVFSIAFIMLSLFVMLVTLPNPIQKRYENILATAGNGTVYEDKKIYFNNNLSLRIFLWNIGLQDIKEKNLWIYGSGNGDYHDLINQKLLEKHVIDDINPKNKSGIYNVNFHNMYLQSFFMLGILGLLCFLTIVLLPFYYLLKIKFNYLNFIFFSIPAAFMLQESSLQTQSGIMFYTFFYIVFIVAVYPPNKQSMVEK